MKELLNDWHHLFTLKGGDFASTYNKLTSNDASHNNYESKKLCNPETDPDGTYDKALTKITDAIRDIRDVYFFVIKS